jgi:SAM-dependent methyltransferase
MHEIFEAHVRSAPSAAAVECDRGTFTYAALDAAANRLAHALKRRGVISRPLSGRAVAFCRRSTTAAATAFVHGDAEELPFADATVDVAINIESSSTYPNIRKFFGEVFRVLNAGGDFLYSDVLPVRQASDSATLLQAIGIRPRRKPRHHAQRAPPCDEVARTRLQAYSAPGGVIGNFLGMPGPLCTKR